MALDVGELVARLKLDRKDFDRGITESEGRFSKLAGALGAAAVKVGAVAGGVIVAAGAVGLRTAASMEQADIGFTTMLGSGAKAKVFLGELSAFAAKTPFAFPELQTAASSLISAGIEADKVIPIMTTLGDVTSGMGTGSEGVKRATIALQQMNAAGRITGEDLNQLRDAGIPVYDLLANATGKTKAEVVALAQAGKLGKTELDAMMKALETGGGLEKFTGLMEKQSTSLTGLWSTLKDTFSMGMATAIQPLIPIIKEGLGGAISGLAGVLPRVTGGFQSAANAVSAFAEGLRGNASGNTQTDVMNRLARAGDAVRVGFAAAKGGVLEFAGGLSMSAGETAAYGGALDGAAAAGNRVGGVIRTVVAAVREFTAGATMSKGETAAYGAALGGVATVGNRVGGVVRSVIEAVRDFMAGLRTSKAEADAYGGALDGMALVGLRVREALTAVFEAIRSGDVGKLKDGFAGASEKAAGLTGGLQSMTDLLPSLGTLIGTAADVVKFLADNSGLLVDALPFLIAGFVLYKASQVAANVAALASLPILVAQVVQGFALAASNNALAAALGYQRVSVLSSTLAWIGNTAATVANGVATLALRAGILLTRGAIIGITVVQWLWTAAMAASGVAMAVLTSPIGAVVAVIALLVGGFVLAWRHSETFRNIVVGAINGAKDVTLSVVGAMVGAWFFFADKILFAAEKALGWTGTLGDKVSQARAGMAAVAGAIQGEIEKLKGKDIVLDVKANGAWTMSDARVRNEHTGRAGLAVGGAVTGPGTGTSDSIPAMLSNGEHVWTTQEVQQAGGHTRMYALRAAVRSGALGAFATGGAVGTRAAANIGRIVPEQYDPTERALLSGIAGATATGIAAAQAAAASASSAPGGVAGRGNVDAELLRRFDAWNASMGGVLRIVSGYRSSAKQAQLYASYLAGTGNLAARPGSSNHEKSPARAIDYGPASWSRTPGAYAYGLKAPVRSEPWHLERAFDDGGVARGSGMMPKFTPRPERVLSPRQTEAFERLVDVLDDRVMGGSAVMGGVTYSGTVNVVDPEEFARRTVARQRDAAVVAGLTSIL